LPAAEGATVSTLLFEWFARSSLALAVAPFVLERQMMKALACVAKCCKITPHDPWHLTVE